jgi:hypothetical protein
MLVVELHELQILRKAKRSSVTRLAVADQQQPSLICFFNVLMNSFETTEELQPEIM